MNAQRTVLMIAVGAIVLTSCTSYALPEVSGPYAGRLTQDDIRQIARLPFTQNSIRRGVHSIYAKRPNEADVQSAMPKWPNDTIVSFTARKKAGPLANHRWLDLN